MEAILDHVRKNRKMASGLCRAMGFVGANAAIGRGLQEGIEYRIGEAWAYAAAAARQVMQNPYTPEHSSYEMRQVCIDLVEHEYLADKIKNMQKVWSEFCHEQDFEKKHGKRACTPEPVAQYILNRRKYFSFSPFENPGNRECVEDGLRILAEEGMDALWNRDIYTAQCLGSLLRTLHAGVRETSKKFEEDLVRKAAVWSTPLSDEVKRLDDLSTRLSRKLDQEPDENTAPKFS